MGYKFKIRFFKIIIKDWKMFFKICLSIFGQYKGNENYDYIEFLFLIQLEWLREIINLIRIEMDVGKRI